MNNIQENDSANDSKTTPKKIVLSRTQRDEDLENKVDRNRGDIDKCHEHIHVMGNVKRSRRAVAYNVPLQEKAC
jgi:hypothetical protein